MMFLEEELLRRLEPDAERPGRRARPLRVAVYSHDAQGLGHLRRNLLVSRSLFAEDLRPSVLLISGLRETAAYDLPAGVDSVTLPAFGKAADGSYYPRSLRVETEHLVRLRSALIHAAVASFQPDVLIVDKLPLGLFGELKPALIWLRDQMGVSIVLGLRDILDEPEAVRRDWDRDNCTAAIREYYDRVWVYGDRRVFDTAAEYSLPGDVAAKVRYTGYLNPRDIPAGQTGARPGRAAMAEVMDLPRGPLTLCVIGGGRDGVPLATAFLQARLPEGAGGVLVTGPLMEGEDRALLHALAENRPEIRLIEFVTDPQPLMCCADRVICMGGYNTVCEVLAFQKRALIVPRVRPRREQIIRAERLVAMGLVDMLHPDALSGEALSEWIASAKGAVRPAESSIDFHGASRLPELLVEALLAAARGTTRTTVVVTQGKAAEHV
jgi:predicted glycosyltransferase